MSRQLEQSPRIVFNMSEEDEGVFFLDEEDAEMIRKELEFAEKAYDALKIAAKTFRDYEQNHLQKSPPDFKKAERNGRIAKMMEDILSPPVSKNVEEFEEDVK